MLFLQNALMKESPVFNLLIAPIRRFLQNVQHKRDQRLSRESRFILEGDNFEFLDIGAAGGILPRFFPYRASIAFTGFEPDERSVRELLRAPASKHFANYSIIPSAVWSYPGKLDITFTRKPMCSSAFQPNTSFLSRFKDASRFDIINRGAITCNTLDELLKDGSGNTDFIKLDLEGGELAALEGGVKTLQTCLGLHVEVCFQHLRIDQPLFGNISETLRKSGFEFIDFVTLCRWARDGYDGTGQLAFADALYLRPPEDVVRLLLNGSLKSKKAQSYLWLLFVYQRYDLATGFLDLATQNHEIIKPALIEKARGLIAKRNKAHKKKAIYLGRLGSIYNYLMQSDSSLHGLY